MAPDKLSVIGWIDLTKVGVLTQKDCNKFAAWSEKLMSKNPTGDQLS